MAQVFGVYLRLGVGLKPLAMLSHRLEIGLKMAFPFGFKPLRLVFLTYAESPNKPASNWGD
tara:strand:+ start:1669 stop:1851 length:183 start_codon:yes stop_codon:yes gene_type:complete